MNRRHLTALALVAACSDPTPTGINQLNFDRPVDIAFACYGGLRLTGGGAATVEQEIISSAQPIAACNIRSGRVRDPVTGQLVETPPPGQESLPEAPLNGSDYFAFILQSGPGTVALARFDAKPTSTFSGRGDVEVLDTDPLTPGKNGITVGEDPVAIVTDRAGCFEVIANSGSCDMSVLDINSIFTSATPGEDPIVNRLVVTNATGQPIAARPAAMVIEPPTETIGNACPATPTGLAYVAYPGCHLVAGIDVSTGQIVTGIQFDATTGAATVVDGNVTCPSECDGAGMVTAGIRPVTLDLELDARSGRRLLAIGADNSNLVTMFDLDGSYLPFGAPVQVALENTTGRLGVTDVAISPLISVGGEGGPINDDAPIAGDHQFVYAVATDSTVRAIDLTGAARECDAQVDPRFLREERNRDRLACLPVGDAATPPRRVGARGPGIELTGDAVPTSVEFFRIQTIFNEDGNIDDGRTEAGRLIGYYAMVTSANGLTYVVNVDDDELPDFTQSTSPIATQIPRVIAHQLRDATPFRDELAQLTVDPDNDPDTNNSVSGFVCDNPGPDIEGNGATSGGPRLSGNIVRTIPTGVIAPEKVGGLPSIRQVLCDATFPEEEDRPVSELFFSAPLDVRTEVFPDLRGLRNDETWSLTYEGSLSLDGPSAAVDGPAVRESQLFVDGLGMRIVDGSRPFCEAGVEPYDIVQMRGCDPSLGDAGCALGYTCYVHPQSQIAGLGSCMLTNEAERLANACRDYLTSFRRYTVARTTAGELTLLPRKHVLRTTPLTGCTGDDQCAALAEYAASNASGANPVDDTTPPDPKMWACQVDPDRRPGVDAANQPLRRCLLTCETNEDCVTGTVCTANAASPAGGYCMEGVVPPQSCVNAAQRYELRAAEAFTLLGTRSGYVHPIIADANGSCVRDPNAHPYQVGRIPLSAPACDPTADPVTGQRPDGTFEPNPCELTVDETEYQLNYVEGTCTLGMPDESIVTRDATGLRIRTRGLQLTLVDPTYQGDLRCHGDRDGMLQEVPIVPSGYQLAFRQTAGFSPLTLPVDPAFPVKVTRGPLQSIWVIDEGDYLSTSIAQPSTRGRVYRVESQVISTVNKVE